MARIVVVGGGQAGYSAAAGLRSLGFDGEVTLICGENELPYQRPPLSKKYLLGELDRERLFLRQDSFYSENGISLRTGEWCRKIDLDRKRLHLENDEIPFDTLVLATGSVPRRLPPETGGDLSGVHAVRDIADIDRISSELGRCGQAVVIGGGYIGLEAAASLTAKGLKVTVVEMAARILQRVAAKETSEHLRDLHRGHGTAVMENTALESLVDDGKGRVSAAKLADGRVLEADLVIVGIGVRPAAGLAERAGLELENGIKANGCCRTSSESVFAAGDCASFPWKGGRIRLESVQNAIDQAECAAANALGAAREYAPVPWFWSDQYDTRLQIAGLGAGYDRIVRRPGGDPSAVSHWYFQGDELLAVDAVNDARSYMVGKRLLETGKPVDAAALADTGADIKALLR